VPLCLIKTVSIEQDISLFYKYFGTETRLNVLMISNLKIHSFMKENIYTSGFGDDLRISHEASKLLLNISKWTRFLSILGFVVLGLMILSILGVGGFIGTVNHYEASRGFYPYVPGMFSWVYASIHIIMLLVFMVPVYYLFKFSANVKKAVETNNTMVLTDAIGFLQKHYLFIGVLTIIWLVLIVLSIILIFAGFAGMGM